VYIRSSNLEVRGNPLLDLVTSGCPEGTMSTILLEQLRRNKKVVSKRLHRKLAELDARVTTLFSKSTGVE